MPPRGERDAAGTGGFGGAMDDRLDQRQAQIREGAGLDEARINQDFLDFLKRWGVYALLLLAIAFALYNGRAWWQNRKLAQRAEAFAALNGQLQGPTPNPTVLQRIAEEYRGVAGVATMAKLTAADVFLTGARAGIRWDAETQNPANPSEDALLTPEERDEYLTFAERLYRQALEEAPKTVGAATQRVGAYFGLAAVAESRQDPDAARSAYESAAEVAERFGFAELAEAARQRIEDLDGLDLRPSLLSEADLPPLPQPPAMPGADGEILDLSDFILPGEVPEAPADAAPAGEGAGEPSDGPAGDADAGEQPGT